MISDLVVEVYGDFHKFMTRGREHLSDMTPFGIDMHSRKLCNKKGCEKCKS
jgi:hypothetical protein